jgi:hypothetical protein
MSQTPPTLSQIHPALSQPSPTLSQTGRPVTTSLSRIRSEMMPTRRFLFALPIVALLSACQPAAIKPDTKVVVNVRVPANDDNPLAGANAGFIALIADFPGSDGKLFDIQRYAQGVQVKVPTVPFGQGRQIRVDVYEGTDQPTVPFARGTSVPVDVAASSPPVELHPYVTLINHFAAIFGEPDTDGNSIQTALPDSHVATAVVALPNGKVLMAGGAVPKAGAKNPFDPASYSAMQPTVALYDADSRVLSYASDPGFTLATGRGFHTMSVGQNNVAIVGGVEMDAAGKPRASNRIEFYNMTTGEVTVPLQADSGGTGAQTMKFGRIAPTVIQMFEHQDYFLILGGQGNEPCPANPRDGLCGGNTWEIWHATAGFRAIGQLSSARWHHSGVRVPGPDGGGFVMLVGGENTQGPLTTLEVVQFSVNNNNVLVSDSLTNCPADCPSSPAGFLWNPVSYPNQPVRIWPAALFVAHLNNLDPSMSYYHVYMIGGFSDLAHTNANKTVDVFDIQQSAVIATRQMSAGRAAPLVAAVSSGPSAGQVLIAGGSNTDTSHTANGEFLHVDKDDGGNLVINIDKIENQIGDGDRTLGAAMGLSTGHVLMLGGTGGNASSLTGRTDAVLWNPY